MTDAINALTLNFHDVDGQGWTLETLKGKPVLLMVLQGPDAPNFDKWVEPIRGLVGPKGVVLQPVLDASPIPKMLWWGVKKMKGALMRERRPEGLPRVLLDMEGDVFRKLHCMPGHLSLVLTDRQGTVSVTHLVPTTELQDATQILGPVLQAIATA